MIVSEIIDDDYAQFKKRREGLFFGVQGLVNNSMIAIAAALSLIGLLVISRLHIRGEGK